jgi:dipeptidyl aminopeptidase/acylaminoacyl peptidase
MKGQALAAIFAAVSISISLPQGASAQPVTPEMFGALPNVAQAEIAPDGKTVAAVQNGADGMTAVALYDLTGTRAPTAVTVGEGKIRWLQWVNNNYALALVSDSKTFGWGNIATFEIGCWLSVDKNAGKAEYLTGGFGHSCYFGPGDIESTLPAEPDHILVGQWNNGVNLFKVDLRTGHGKVVEDGKYETYDWVVDVDGTPLVRMDYDEQRKEITFFAPKTEGGRFEKLSALPQPRDSDDTAFWAVASAGSATQVHGFQRIGDFLNLVIYDVATGSVRGEGLSAPGYDVSGSITDAVTGSVVGATYTDDMPRTLFIDPDLASVQRALERALQPGAPSITSWSNDRSKFMVRVDYADHPSQFFVFDRAGKRLDMFAASHKSLDGKLLAAKERYDYLSSDGLHIMGYLTVPSGAPKRSMPLVVLPHGGPWARDDMSFEWWSFFYAARGYLVYQPQFRGSDGFGLKFRQAGYREYGKKMQDDITEGVEKLIADGIVDPTRICIVGGSYGGYAALAGATLTPDLYACAVSVNGVANIPANIFQKSGRNSGNDWWNKAVGNRVNDANELRAVSPVYLAGKAKAPILLIHAKDDIVVSPGQSRGMRDALQAARKQVEYVELKGEDHWLSRAETRTEMLARSIEFIDKHIGAGASVASN